ncbi:MAG: glycosyltransferase [Candidatus Pacearchaeota archaeon]|jgi:glycosyltransferase involved in cell wall biosynthesis
MISIIIPAHNEELRIGPTLEAYGRFFSEKVILGGEKYEIIVVLNACKDKTLEIVKTYSKKYKIIKYLDFKQGGKGFAVIEGFKQALKNESDTLGFVDADMATSPEAFYDLIKNINSYDGIIASRYIKGSKVKPKPSFARIFVSRIFNALIRILFFMPYRDTQCGAKVFKKNAIKQTINKLSMSQWAFDVELLYCLRKQGFKIKEIPTTWSDKKYSKINFMKAGPKMALSVIRLRLVNSPFKGIVSVYNRLPIKLHKLTL